MKNISKLILPILGLIMLLLTTTVTAQSKSDTKDFLIRVKKDGQNMKLKCIMGCTWTDLKFSITTKSSQTVDQYGTLNTDNKTPKKDKSLSNFKFTVDIVNEGFVLKALKGTSWEKLSFTTDKVTEMINKEGILTKN